MGTPAYLPATEPARPDELATLYGEHAASVRRSLLEFGAEPGDVDDLCQEVFLVARRRFRDLPLGSALRCRLWLRQVSRRVVAAQRRRAYRRHEELLTDVGGGRHDALAANDDHRPDAFAERRERASLARAAFGTLDGVSQRILELHVVEGLPLVQVALAAVCDRKTARKRLRLAQRRLLAWFDRHDAQFAS